ncbi:MAG: DEAD/DEAH box helicase [Planctomycetota bacterium]
MAIDFSKAYPDEEPKPGARKAKSAAPKRRDAGRSIYEAALSGVSHRDLDADYDEEERPQARPRRRRRKNGDESAEGAGVSRGDSGRQQPARHESGRQESAQQEGRGGKRRDRRHEGKAIGAKDRSDRLAAARDEEIPEDAHFGGKFRAFDLSAPVLKAIEDMGWSEPSEIQRLVIPRVLLGRDVVGQARTGTGKTGAFAIPLVERYRDRPAADGQARYPVALILSPTRELALQIYRQLEELGAYTQLRSVAVYGGAPMEPQLRALRAGADIVVGTPGRVMDHIRRRTLKLDSVSYFVLDEADRMFDLGFREDIYWISRRLPEHEPERQTLLLSATMPDEVVRLSKEVTSDPELIYTTQGDESQSMTVQTVEQFYVSVDNERKMGLLEHIMHDEDPPKGIVFTRTKRGADKVALTLRKAGFDAGEIHSDLRQKKREQILERFREGNLRLMIATDVAARGLDIQGVTHVFNFDVPENAEDYVHRVGRTARMGQTGRAFTFVSPQDGGFLTEIEKLINLQLPHYDVDGYRCEASEEERHARELRNAPRTDHPMTKQLSPALLAILNNRRGGPRAGGGGGRGGPGGRGGGPGGRGRSGGGGRRGRGGGGRGR